jgi:hypothetical protein
VDGYLISKLQPTLKNEQQIPPYCQNTTNIMHTSRFQNPKTAASEISSGKPWEDRITGVALQWNIATARALEDSISTTLELRRKQRESQRRSQRRQGGTA